MRQCRKEDPGGACGAHLHDTADVDVNLRRAGFGQYLMLPGFLASQQSAALSRCAAAPETRAQVVRDGIERFDERFRSGTCAGLGRHEAGVHQRLLAALPALAHHFGVELEGCDRPKLLVYRAGDFFKAHRDKSDDERLPEIARRRITTITFVQDGETQAYGGGELFLYPGDEDTPSGARVRVSPEAGAMVAFPSETFHEVARVRWGERRTIVSWFY